MQPLLVSDVKAIINTKGLDFQDQNKANLLQNLLNFQNNNNNDNAELTSLQHFNLIRQLVDWDILSPSHRIFAFPLRIKMGVHFFSACKSLVSKQLFNQEIMCHLAQIPELNVNSVATSFSLLTQKKWDNNYTEMFWEFPFEFHQLIKNTRLSDLKQDTFSQLYSKCLEQKESQSVLTL